MSSNITDVQEFITDLDAGVFEKKIGAALTDVAYGVVNHGKAGQVVITLDIKQLGNAHQVMVAHKLKYTNPTGNGEVVETDKSSTPMHVGAKGMTLWPDKQDDLFGAERSKEKSDA